MCVLWIFRLKRFAFDAQELPEANSKETEKTCRKLDQQSEAKNGAIDLISKNFFGTTPTIVLANTKSLRIKNWRR